MIYLEHAVTGGTIGGKLAEDPEEAYYALVELVDESPSDFAEQVAEFSDGENAETIATWLRTMASAFDEVAAS